MSENAIDKLVSAIGDIPLNKVREEIGNLREIRKWAVANLGLDYSEGDEVTVISPEPYLVGGGWDPYKNALRTGRKGTVLGIEFNPTSGKWTANVRFPNPEQKEGASGHNNVFSLHTDWVAKEPPGEEHAPAEMALVASELQKAEGKLAFVSHCCDIMERGTEPMVPLQQVRNMLETPHRILTANIEETATEGIETPGCNCGREGRGRAWHSTDCSWRSGFVVCERCRRTEAQGCGCGTLAQDARSRFAEAVNKALSDWHSDVPETQDVAKNAYLVQKVTEVHEALLGEMFPGRMKESA